MIVSALNRYDQAVQVNAAHERTKVMLDAMPLATQIWDKDINLIDCNDETVKLFKVKDKKEYLENFFDFNPEFLGDGSSSKEVAIDHIRKTFDEGKRVVEWMHYTRDGSELPVEVTLARINFGGETYVASYARDLREYKKMIKEIENRDMFLNAVIANYSGIIWSVNRDYEITLFNGRYLGVLGLKPDSFEGKYYKKALSDGRFQGICECVPKTFENGPQDYNTEHEGKTYRIRTTPIHENGIVTNVMGSFDDITERTRLQVELKAALTEAQEANDAKSHFLARMSHEMRTPLNAVIGLSELTLESGSLSADAYTNLERIYSAGATMLGTVNDILDISKIEAGKFELVPVEYNIPSLINDAVTQCITRIESKPINFILDINENLPTRLYGDDLRIKQILNNLLSNAFKYTKEGTVELSMRCEREPDGNKVRMIILVKDTGVGIQSNDINNVFSDYPKLDMVSHRKIEGTGLGLSITKRLAEMMSGTISVESEYGKGSVFTVTVLQQFVTDAIIGAEIVESLKKFNYQDHRRRQNSLMTRILMPKASVLVVDDVTTNLDVAKGMLKPYGMKIDCVQSGQEAVHAIRGEEIKYNAIFMDHMMPEMDGIEAVRIIREEIGTEYAKTIPIIALTANAIIGNEEMFLSKGFQAFLPKPIDVVRLDAIIREFVWDKNLDDTFEDTKKEAVYDHERRAGSDRKRHANKNLNIEIPGLDVNTALTRFGGDGEAYLRVLHSYAVNTPSLLDSIRNVNDENIKNYSISIHGLKSASRGIGAEILGYMAEALEEASKARDFSFINTNNIKFIEAAEKLIRELNIMLEKKDAESKKPKKDSPDKEVLLRLLGACERYDMDGVDAAIAELERYEYEKDGILVNWLRENIDKMNFIEIAEKLSSLQG
jgi:PAS domain S-box-containing protein